MINDYSFTYKDKSPEETILLCQQILSDIGISVTERPYQSGDSLFGIDISSDFGFFSSHGKGTTAAYAKASGYAEFLERLQNLYFSYSFPEELEDSKFFPDEKVVSIEEGIYKNQHFINDLTSIFVASTGNLPKNDYDFLSFWQSYFYNTTSCSILPYFSIKNKSFVNLPGDILYTLQGSTGECAGNTPEEALTQGISEIFERWSEFYIYLHHLTPPEVPFEYIEKVYPKQWNIIKQIYQINQGYELKVFDCSLGKGVPVIAVLFSETSTGRYILQYGAFPKLEIALERCLTELFQGLDMKNPISRNYHFTDISSADAYSDWFSFDNCRDRLDFGRGYIPLTFLQGDPSWEFTDWSLSEDFSYKKAFSHMIDLCLKFSEDVYIRNNSFLGFPTFNIYIPGMSIPVYPRIIDKDQRDLREILRTIGGIYPRLTLEDNQILGEFISNNPNVFVDFSDNSKEPIHLLKIKFLLYAHKYSEAQEILRPLTYLDKKYKALSLKINLIENELSEENQNIIISRLYGNEVAAYLRKYFGSKNDSILYNTLFPDYIEESEKNIEKINNLYKKLQEKMKTFKFNQKFLDYAT